MKISLNVFIKSQKNFFKPLHFHRVAIIIFWIKISQRQLSVYFFDLTQKFKKKHFRKKNLLRLRLHVQWQTVIDSGGILRLICISDTLAYTYLIFEK